MTWKDGQYQPKQKRADEKKERLLDAALELFSTEGYHGTTAKAIAARAGVATGSFYRYFKDKKVVFLALCKRMERELGGRIFLHGQDMRRQGLSEREILTSMIQRAVKGHHHHQGFHREVLAMQICDADVAAWVHKREARLLTKLREFLEPRQDQYRVSDLEAAAELFYGTIEETAHRAVLFESTVGADRLIRELQDMLARYLLP